MFKLDNRATRFFPVEVLLKDDSGRERKYTFDGEFEVIDQDEAEQLLVPDSNGLVLDVKVCDRVFRGWRKGSIQDANGEDLEPTDANIASLLKRVGLRGFIVRAWTKSVGLDARLKN